MVRIGVIGIGNMGRQHIVNVKSGKIKNGYVAAACDIREDRLAWLDGMGYTDIKKFTSERRF